MKQITAQLVNLDMELYKIYKDLDFFLLGIDHINLDGAVGHQLDEALDRGHLEDLALVDQDESTVNSL